MLTGANDFEMVPLDAKAHLALTQTQPPIFQTPSTTPLPPVQAPNYYYHGPPSVPITTPPHQVPQPYNTMYPGYFPYYYAGPVPATQLYPVYPVTQYPVFSIPIQVPVSPHQKYTLPTQTQLSTSAPSESTSVLPSYAQLFPGNTKDEVDDKAFFDAVRPKKERPATTLHLPNMNRLMHEGQTNPKYPQQRCRNCGTYFTEEMNGDKVCLYHSGRFKTPESVRPIMMPVGNLQRWTCCKATSKEAIGCKNARHVSDQKTAEIINRFAAAPQRHQLSSSAPSSLLVQIDSDEDGKADVHEEVPETKEMQVFYQFHGMPPDKKGVLKESGGTKVIRHTVIATDTLSGLSLKYGVKAADIKRANNLIGDSIFERKHLDIPNPTRIPDQAELSGELPKCGKEEIAVSRFVSATKAGKEEARYYLVDFDWHLEKAIAAFRADEDWANANPCPQERNIRI